MRNARRWAAGVALALGAATMYREVVRPSMYAWGARADEVDAVLPGDDLVSARTPRTTRALTIIRTPRPMLTTGPRFRHTEGLSGCLLTFRTAENMLPSLFCKSAEFSRASAFFAYSPKSSLNLTTLEKEKHHAVTNNRSSTCRCI